MRDKHPEIKMFEKPKALGPPRFCKYCQRGFCSLELHQNLYRHKENLTDEASIKEFRRIMDQTILAKIGNSSDCFVAGCHFRGINLAEHTYKTGHCTFQLKLINVEPSKTLLKQHNKCASYQWKMKMKTN